MDATFVIGFHTQRFDNLLQTLRFLRYNHESFIQNCQLVTICQDEVNKENISKVKFETTNTDQSGIIGEFNYWCRYFGRWDHFDMNIEYMRLPILTNFGISKAVADKIFLLESDRILPVGYFEQIYEKLQQGYQWTSKNMWKLTHPALDDQIKNGNYEHKNEHRSNHAEIGMRSMWSGNTAFMKNDFYKAGKMDTEYKGYGWADNDMTLTMELAGIQSIFEENALELHLWHYPATYDGNKDSRIMFIENGLKFCTKWNKPIPDWLQKDIDDIQRRHLI